MALAVQPQWDIGSSAFSIGTGMLGLIAAATQDDVQVAAVVAAEAIGAQMIVNPKLFGQAVGVLNEGKSYKIEKIKLHFGLSKGGISGQSQQSSAAIRTFLLVSVLRLGLTAKEISEVLFEMLAEIQGMKMLPVSAFQLQSFVDALEGYSLKMGKLKDAPVHYVGLVMERAADHSRSASDVFKLLTPDTASKILLLAFEAVRDEGIQHLEMRGKNNAVWIVMILCWLFPHAVRVLDWRGFEFISSTSQPPKISIFLDDGPSNWRLQHWHKTKDLVSSIIIPRSQTYAIKSSPTIMSKRMMYACIQARSEPRSVGPLASAYVIAAVKYGQLGLPESEEVFPHSKSSATIPLSDVCSISFMQDMDSGLLDLGWPEGSVNLDHAYKIADSLASSSSYKLEQNIWDLAIKENETDESLVQLRNQANENSGRRLRHARRVAECLLARITQEDWTEIQPDEFMDFPADTGQDWDVRDALFASPTRCLGIDTLLTKSFSTCFEGQAIFHDELLGTLAVSSRGQTILTRGLLLEDVEAPRNAREALQLMVLPGQVKLRGTSQNLLQEFAARPSFSTIPRLATYELDRKGQHGRPLLNTLLDTGNTAPIFAITQGSRSSTIHLRCSIPAAREDKTLLLPSLVNWAFAYRVEPGSLSLKEQQQECLGKGITKLLLRSPTHDPIHNSPEWSSEECRVIASYSGNAWDNILQFGTFGAMHVHLIRQGKASVFECAVAAEEKLGKGWMIMANP